MMRILRRSFFGARPLLAGIALLAPGVSWAGADASITFSPLNLNATSVPTLGGAMLILLALFLSFIALRAMRHRSGSGRISSILVATLALGTLLSTAGGVSLLRSAGAGMTPSSPITNSMGQTTFSVSTTTEFINESGVVQQVIAFDAKGTGCSVEPSDVPIERDTIAPSPQVGLDPPLCEVNKQLPDSATCFVRCSEEG